MREFRDQRITYSHLAGETGQIIAHELAHNLTGNYLGFNEARKLPRWKTEGYSEYISTISRIRKDSSDSFKTRCELYYLHSLFDINAHSKFYYKSQILTEFLFEHERYRFNKFIEPGCNLLTTEAELLSWLNRVTTPVR